MKKYKNLLLIVLAFLAGSILSLSTTLVLAHGGNTNLIHGCVKNSNGSIRIVGANDNCNGGETAQDWSKGSIFSTFPICPNCDLTAENLSGINLTRAYFPDADLHGKNLTGITFTKANLQEANLSNSNFSQTIMTNANLRFADLTNTNFSQANLTNTNLSGSNATNTNFTNANLNNLTGIGNIVGGIFTGANLSNAGVHLSTFNNYNGTVTGIIITNSNLSSDSLLYIDLTGATLTNNDFSNSNFDYVNFTNANLQNNNLTNSGFSNTNFTNANLTGSIGIERLYEGNIWSNTICPDGTNSDNNGNNCQDHLTP